MQLLYGIKQRISEHEVRSPAVARKAELIAKLGNDLWQSSAQFSPERRNSAALLARALGRQCVTTAEAVMDAYFEPDRGTRVTNAEIQVEVLIKRIDQLEPEFQKMEQQPRTARERVQRQKQQESLLKAQRRQEVVTP